MRVLAGHFGLEKQNRHAKVRHAVYHRRAASWDGL